ncbi:hypothetical protein ZHAS_00003655 [Anopheles sinensis]|uniref:Uncharacterized protein n=1 Tax=Anopheles sinensis TaxID=74873 RepID=A0A084VEW1_ANOSI|nr:hypothetical protein ZHAS_00003655 [Anopheles sinensis]
MIDDGTVRAGKKCAKCPVTQSIDSPDKPLRRPTRPIDRGPLTGEAEAGYFNQSRPIALNDESNTAKAPTAVLGRGPTTTHVSLWCRFTKYVASLDRSI